MTAVSRRSLVAGLGALALPLPSMANATARADFDVLIVGAGAAGISAARHILRAGKTVAILEGSDRLGGRCLTDTRTFSRPYDAGAQWIHETEGLPLAELCKEAGLEVHRAAPTTYLRIPTFQAKQSTKYRPARDSELEHFYNLLVRCNRAIADAGGASSELSCEKALPDDLGLWRPTMQFLLGPFRLGNDLAKMSPAEYLTYLERDNSVRVPGGIGILMRKLAFGLPIQYFSPVSRIDWSSQGGSVETRDMKITARAVIVTASTAVLAANKISFKPALPFGHADAFNKLKLGSYDRVAIDLHGPGVGPADSVWFELAKDRQTAAAHTNFLGSPLSFVQIGGQVCADLNQQGQEAMTSFAIEWLASHFGSDVKKTVKGTHATQWDKNPWTLGAFSYASPLAGSARKILSQPLGNRIWFAGEAVHETMWGTVAGAWETGQRAAAEVVRRIGG